jgi:hypothetical protein
MIGMFAACARARAGCTASELSGHTTIAFTFWVMNVSMSESCLSTLRFASTVLVSRPCLAASAFRPPSSRRSDGSAPCGMEKPMVPLSPAADSDVLDAPPELGEPPPPSSSSPHAPSASTNTAATARIATRRRRERSARMDGSSLVVMAAVLRP